MSFFTGEEREMSVRSLDFSTFLTIQRKEFINILQQHQNDYEIYSYIKDQVKFQKNLDKIDLPCPSCKSHKHWIKNCPHLHLNLDRYTTISRQLLK